MPVSAASPEADVCASNVIKIDAEEVTEDTGKTLAEVLGNFDTRATSMPKDTWDWSDGTYSSSFEIDYSPIGIYTIFTKQVAENEYLCYPTEYKDILWK